MPRCFLVRWSCLSRLSHLAIASALFITVGGCSSKKVEARKQVFPVCGTLLVDDQPASGAMLVLHPVGGAYDAEHPAATVAPDGTFKLTTFVGEDGAPPGEYVVTAHWNLSADKDAPGPWPNVIPDKYTRPESSDLRVQVTAGPNQLQPIAIRR
jgi:hypothetical protein